MIANDYRARFAGRAQPYYEPQTGSFDGVWDPRMGPIPGLTGITPFLFSAAATGPAYSTGVPAPGYSSAGQVGLGYPAPLDDDAIRDLIYECIDTDPTILPDVDVDVEVKDGVVTLRGPVPGKRTKHAIGDAAWWIPTVVDVNNQLQVSPRRDRRQQRAGAARGAA